MTATFASATELRPDSPPISPFRRTPPGLWLACMLLLVSCVAWRDGDYFSGGIDSVVVAKALLSLLALALLVVNRRPAGVWFRYRIAPCVWLGLYLAIQTVGALLSGDPLASGVLTVRLGLMAVTVLLMVATFAWETVVSALASAMLTLSFVAAATGVSSISERGRLYGGLPPLNANDLAMMLSFCVLLVFWRMLNAQATWFDYLAMVPMLGVVWLTGSRTSLAALVVALMVVALLTRRMPTQVFLATALAVPIALWVTFFTSTITSFAGRDVADLATLNSRTVAWTAALRYPDTAAEKLFGAGLSLKEIPVSAQYRTEQIFDSSWISALIQSGYLGAGILAIFVVSTYVKAFGVPRAARGLVVAALGMLIMLSIMESGVFDSTPAFALFFCLCLYVHRAPPLAASST